MKLYLLYLLRQLALPTMFATLALSGAIWLSQSLRFVDLIVNKGIPATTFVYLTVLLFPSLLLVILPFALFCAVLFVYQRLTVESELTALKAVGLSNLQIAAPCLLLAIIVTLICYAISLYFMPLAFRSFRDLQQQVEREFSYLLLQPGVFNTPARDLTVYVRTEESDRLAAVPGQHEHPRQHGEVNQNHPAHQVIGRIPNPGEGLFADAEQIPSKARCLGHDHPEHSALNCGPVDCTLQNRRQQQCQK
jgi:hypothetical protein